jgi:hypothetical protein
LNFGALIKGAMATLISFDDGCLDQHQFVAAPACRGAAAWDVALPAGKTIKADFPPS